MSDTAPANPASRPQAAWQGTVPGLFVLLWATGFVIGKLGLPYAPPFTILLLRFAAAAALMLLLSVATRAPWPRSGREALHIAVVGLLLQTVYLGGCYAAMADGIPAGLTALIVGLQPLLTATVVGPLLGERVTQRQWIGLVIGFAGVMLVLWDKLDFAGLQLRGFVYALGALVGISAAIVYQKRFCGTVDLRSGAVIQYGAAALGMLPLALGAGFGGVRWTATFLFSFAWLVLVLSLGTISLLLWLVRRGVASKVASLFYLTPPVAAFGGFLLFGETLAPPALAGMALAALGVALVNRG
jgi:drug/metabolite transporter (DMT)-like permease